MFPNKDCINCPPCPPVIPAVPIPDLSHICGNTYDLSCIRYTGPNIPCLEIFSGTMMDVVLQKFNAALAVCECCYEPPIPDIDCVVSDWSPWTPDPCINCVPAGTGSECTQTRTREIITLPSGFGAICPILSETQKVCCPINCVSTYTYSACNPATSTKIGTLVITTPASCGGTPCPAATIIQDCIPDVNCVMSDWSAPTDCEAGYTRRTRTVITPASGNGTICGPLEELTVCSEPPVCEPVSNVQSGLITSTQSTPLIPAAPINAQVSFTEVTGADDYTLSYTLDNGVTWLHITSPTSPIGLSYDPVTECGKTIEGYIVTNCTNGLTSQKVDFKDIITPACIPSCTRPTSLLKKGMLGGYSTHFNSLCGPTVNIITSAQNLAAVCIMWDRIKTCGCDPAKLPTYNMNGVELASLNLNQKVYVGQYATNCNTLPAGFYIFYDFADISTPTIIQTNICTAVPKVITIASDGTISKIETCVPPCTRPIGLLKRGAIEQFVTVDGPSCPVSTNNIKTAQNLAAVCAMWNKHKTCGCDLTKTPAYTYSNIELASATQGQTVYVGHGATNCNVLPAGFYIYYDFVNITNGPVIQTNLCTLTTIKVLTIDNFGVITKVETCTYTPPPPCSGNYQALLSGADGSGNYNTKKINNNGIYNPADAAVAFSTPGGVVVESVLGINGFYITGNFDSIKTSASRGIGKVTCGNIKDTEFNVGSGFNKRFTNPAQPGSGYSIAHDPILGRIYVGGDFSEYNGNISNNFVVLNDKTGAMITSATSPNPFSLGAGFKGTPTFVAGEVYAIKIQPDGKILVAGRFKTYKDQPVNQIIRLNTDGSKDPSFNAKVFVHDNNAASIDDMVLDTDGSIFVTGTFSSYDGQAFNLIIKLIGTGPNAGALDPLFLPTKNITGGTNPNTPLRVIGKTLLIQGNFILVSGDFHSYDTTKTRGLMRLNKITGALDLTYTKDIGTNTPTDTIVFNAIKEAPNGDILVLGFTPTGFQGDSVRKVYYVLNPITLAIDTSKTSTTPPFASQGSEILLIDPS